MLVALSATQHGHHKPQTIKLSTPVPAGLFQLQQHGASAKACSACQSLLPQAELPCCQQPLLHLLLSSLRMAAASEGRLHH